MTRPRPLRAFALPLSIAALIPAAFAADDKGVFIDPEAAGPDFAIQGEYEMEGGGAQVIALGKGRFRIVGWRGGLPGTADAVERMGEVDAELKGDRVTFQKDNTQGEIAGGELRVTHGDGSVHTLKKVVRTSPTLGAKPPEGAVVLFDGTNADAWRGGKIDSRGFLHCGTTSKEVFGDCSLHIEFRTPFQPTARGQGRGNSGVYLQDRFEVQVLDSFGLSGENNECGGIYGKHKPRINMCYPPLSWQTYDIDFTAARYDTDSKKTHPARMTVRHNGVLIHDQVEVDSATTAAGRKEGAGTGPIQLQDHGNPVFYRNIWVVKK